MKQETQAILARMAAYPLFASVGKDLPPSVTAVHSWKTACKAAVSTKWENCGLMAINTLLHFVETLAWDRTLDWNPFVKEVRPVVRSLAEELLGKATFPPEFFGILKIKLGAHFLGICLEHEYSDVVAPFFHVPDLETWYATGHFPCGWDGAQFPQGWDGKTRKGRVMVF